MSEAKPTETKPKKMVGRNVAITLGIVCIILVAGIGGAMAYYTVQVNNKNSEYNNYVSTHGYTNTQYDTLNSTYNDYVSTHSHTDDEYNTVVSNYNNEVNTYNNYVNDHHHTDEDYNSLSTQNTNLQNQVNDLTNTLNLGNSTIWVNNQTVSEPAGGLGLAWSDWTFSASYAGYVSIYVSSATAGAWTHVIYYSHGVSYNVQTPVGTSGTAYFPILPSSSITVGVGNGNLNSGATQTVTITYYY
jgi:flagellar basal body-associated protein FliL